MPQRLCLPRPLPPVKDDPDEEQHEDEDHAAQQGHEPRLRDQVPVTVVRVADDGIPDECGVHPEADRV